MVSADAPSISVSLNDLFFPGYCLAHTLKGATLYLMAHPAEHVTLDPPTLSTSVADLDRAAVTALKKAIEHGQQIEHDHYLLWFAHLELGRLYTSMGEEHYTLAKQHISLVLEGKVPMSTKRGKGKVSLQSMVVLRAHGASELYMTTHCRLRRPQTLTST